MTRSIPLFLAAALAAGALAGAPAAAPRAVFPTTIALPNGFGPEGIAIGKGPRFYVGSIATGAIYRGSLLTGRGAVLVPAKSGRQAIGLSLDRKSRLFVAGGPTGKAWVYDARTGGDLREYVLTTASPTFVNDVVVTRDGAYFTDSNRQVLYRVPLGPNGQLGGAAQELPLTGDVQFVAGEFNANGIDATPDGKTLVIVQSNTGKLFTVDPKTGVTDEIDLGGVALTAGDGILLDGRTLYVVRNQLNLIAVVRLAPDLRSGSVVRQVTNPGFAVPTTVAEFGNRLYVVNARFGTPVTPDTTYTVTGLRKPR
ncbi:MAG TPA: SMP-30/gluconolactonase/LRE family protein [Gaiellaceae bacterium]|nr:SMP-30/gluconolactonase/LRE family protein [Gaiellaceae bacterium]